METAALALWEWNTVFCLRGTSCSLPSLMSVRDCRGNDQHFTLRSFTITAAGREGERERKREWARLPFTSTLQPSSVKNDVPFFWDLSPSPTLSSAKSDLFWKTRVAAWLIRNGEAAKGGNKMTGRLLLVFHRKFLVVVSRSWHGLVVTAAALKLEREMEQNKKPKPLSFSSSRNPVWLHLQERKIVTQKQKNCSNWETSHISAWTIRSSLILYCRVSCSGFHSVNHRFTQFRFNNRDL